MRTPDPNAERSPTPSFSIGHRPRAKRGADMGSGVGAREFFTHNRTVHARW
jgi:hypothetical protein